MTEIKAALKILPLGGLGEIGMNCMVLEYGDELIVIDCGLMFSDLDHFGVEFVIPDFTYLKDRRSKVKAIIATHGHEDHIGAIPFLLTAGFNCPVYGSTFTTLLLKEKLKEYAIGPTADVRTFKMGETLNLGHFKVTTASVNHSIVDSAALIIDTPVGKIVHTGDFKIDPTPFYGQTLDQAVFGKAGDEGVLLLLSDSTNVERCEHSLSESAIYKSFENLFAAAQGLTLVSMFASNVGRMGQIFEIASKMGKKIALSGRTMEQNVRLGAEAGYLKGSHGPLISLDEIDDYPRNEVIVISTGSQGEYRSALVRVAHGEHKQIQLQPGDTVLMSSKFIPGNEKAIGQMINNLFKQGAEVLYESVHEIHVSGHATRPELKTMMKLTRPRFFIPIHGEYRHLVHHAALAKEAGIAPENVLIVTNGHVVELTDSSCQVVEKFEEGRVLVEGRDGNDISKLILKERRQLGEKGVVFSLLVRNEETRKIISGPEIITKGLANDEIASDLIVQAKRLVKKISDQYDSQIESGALDMDLQETIRVELRRFFNQQTGKKPTVMPIVLDL